MNPCATLLPYVSPPHCSQFCFQKKTGVCIAYEYLPIIEQYYFYLDYTLCLSSVRVLFTLCHGHGLWIWITWKVFFNLVEKCMSTIVDFRLYVSPESIYQYIVDGNIVTHGDCSRFPNAIESGIPMSRSLCALWPGLVEVSHPLGVYYPLGVCQREVDLHLLIHRPWYSCLREAKSWCTSAIHLPLLLWTGSGVNFVATSTLSGILLRDCRIVWHLYSQ